MFSSGKFYCLEPKKFKAMADSKWKAELKEEWKRNTIDYNFSVGEHEDVNYDDIEDALQRQDYLYATKLLLDLTVVESGEPLDYALDQDSPELLCSLLCYADTHGMEFEIEYGYGVCLERLLARSVYKKAERCFLLILIWFKKLNLHEIGFQVFGSVSFGQGCHIYRAMEWLVLDKYKPVAEYFGVHDDCDLYTKSLNDGDWEDMDLLSAFILEGKYDLADILISKGWNSLNPIVSMGGETILDILIYNAKQGYDLPLIWYVSRLSSQLINFNSAIDALNEYESEIKECIPTIGKLLESSCLTDSCNILLSAHTPLEQYKTIDGIKKFLTQPLPSHMSRNKPKSISVIDDVKRLYPELLKKHVYDLKIYLQDDWKLIVSMYANGEPKATKRATIDVKLLEPFQLIMDECKAVGSFPTDFQIQQAFLLLSHNEIVSVVMDSLTEI